MSKSPRIQFKKLKGFPEINEDNRIPTDLFLNASKEIVSVIESFGKLFAPVISDMNGNIEKLSKTYNTNKEKYYFIQDLIILNIDVDNNFTPNALLWLKRALQLICTFFENIFNDDSTSENLKIHLQDAYEKTLKQYHGWFIQNTITLIYRWVPTRSQLIGQGIHHEENIQILSSFIPTMKYHLNTIDKLLIIHNLDDKSKV